MELLIVQKQDHKLKYFKTLLSNEKERKSTINLQADYHNFGDSGLKRYKKVFLVKFTQYHRHRFSLQREQQMILFERLA